MNQSRGGAFTAQISRKRKEREDLFLHSHYHVKAKQSQSQSQSHQKTTSLVPNRILAGYMAHEFLTKGTLLGQIFDPLRAQSVPKSSLSPEMEKSEVYAEVSSLLMTDGAHIPGIVNPSQLARWINQK